MNKLTRKYVAVLILGILTLTAVGFALITTHVQNARGSFSDLLLSRFSHQSDPYRHPLLSTELF